MITSADSNLLRTSASGHSLKTKRPKGRHLVLFAVVGLACHGQSVPRPPGGRIHDVSALVGQTAGAASTIRLGGYGVCDKLQIDFGDGTPVLQINNYDFSNPPQLTHAFKWGGRRTVKADAVQGCFGGAQTTLTVPPFKIGYAMPRPTPCDPVAMPSLPANATVHITTNPSIKINFGCLLNGCVYDADGINAGATQGYPFPTMRPLSLIMKVSGKPFQGGTNATFTTATGGPVEVCANDDNMSDNDGAWGIYVDVDYPGPP